MPIRDCFLGFLANFFSSDSARLVALFSYRLCFSFAVHLERYPAMERADKRELLERFYLFERVLLPESVYLSV